jgi:hypothetical protein
MRKSDKKLDNAIRNALIDVCEQAQRSFEGFQWLTRVMWYSKMLISRCCLIANRLAPQLIMVNGRIN